MIQELLTLCLSIGKFIIAAAFMVIFYRFLYHEKTTFNQCRIYLLSIALVALMISQFSIVVYTPPVKVIEVESSVSANKDLDYKNLNSQAGIVQSTTETSGLNNNSFESNEYPELLTIKNIALTVYICVTSVLFILLFIQFFKIIALKRRGKIISKDGFEIVESAEIPTPFSFYKTIFLSTNLSGMKLEMILKHEQWHIKHRHYLDVFVMELLVRLFWFNPVLWWVRKELRSISEFQADRSVLDEGLELYKYQTVILEEVMENNPYLANGFNNSFTKKRFIMMKNKCYFRYATLRRVLILPFFVCVFSLLCFTTGNSQVKYKMKNAVQTDSLTRKYYQMDTVGEVVDSVTGTKKRDILKSELITIDLKGEKLNKTLDVFSQRLSKVINMLHELYYNNTKSIENKDINFIVSNLDINFANINLDKSIYNYNFLSSITNKEIESTYLNLLKIKKELSWIKRNTPPNKRIYLFQMLLGKIMQDELISKIIAESINTLDSKTELIETIPKSKIEPVKSKKIEKEKRFINKEVNVYNNSNQNEEYLIKPEQIKISNLSFYSKNDRIIKMMKKKQNYAYVLNRYSRKTSIISINKSNPKETLITIAIPIRKNNDWFLVNKEFRIIDKRTQDQYLIRKIEKNLPLDRKIIITGNAEKMIEITMIFPPLKKNVEVVDIIEKNEKNDGWLFENVNINDYSVVNAGKVYR